MLLSAHFDLWDFRWLSGMLLSNKEMGSYRLKEIRIKKSGGGRGGVKVERRI